MTSESHKERENRIFRTYCSSALVSSLIFVRSSRVFSMNFPLFDSLRVSLWFGCRQGRRRTKKPRELRIRRSRFPPCLLLSSVK